MELDERSEAQPQAIRIGLWEGGAEDLIEDESGFEIGAGQRVFDPADAMAQIEALRVILRSGKQALQPPPQVGRLADVGLGVRILGAQQKHSGDGGYGGEDLGVSFRAELDAFGQHLPILIRIRCPLLKTDCGAPGLAVPTEFLTTEDTGAHRGTRGWENWSTRSLRS